MDSVVDFLFEAGMLCKTPRSGYQFLGSGRESVAEHILRTAFIGYVLCKINVSLDENRVLKMCLFHDLPEARTGDMNYVNKKYVEVDEAKAVRELTEGLFFGDDIRETINEFNNMETQEARSVRDADQIALILQLKECGDLGNKYADEWIQYALQRLVTEEGKTLADRILQTDFSHWWFKEKNDWWINGKNR
ncbi:MAG: HD domain-containing protein [Syntrophaceae bacterium]|jgi:putative hydrolases of HD superfamily|nr:HD domain-containing protein [Syntrophaceae bacterium]HOC58514.1 HD domain-containing protein [Smithellaceae bacterium]HQM44829.1 HD domain-containing protein [Smithellaceae bacterium]